MEVLKMTDKTLIIEISYAGLGDHLFHSHLPRIAKESGKYNAVFISNQSKFGHPDYKKLIWEMNPFLDGFVDEPGIKCDIAGCVEKVNPNSPTNLLDQVMFWFHLDNGITWNQPEVYYQPVFRSEFAHIIYDPNFVSWIGNVIDEDAMIYFKKNKIHFDYVMKLRGNKTMFIPNEATKFIETPTLFDFCDLIFSCKQLYCLTSGTATLAAALKKPAIVFWGKEQFAGFQHFKKHDYQFIPRDVKSRIRRKLSKLFS
jgi:hypothetical protein